MGSISKKDLVERVRRGKVTRDQMVANNLSEGIAFQIQATRDARGWTQAELAGRAGIANNLPRLEDPDYGKQTITTLKKLTSALDVALVVRFVPFSQYIDWLSGTPHLDEGISPESLAVPSFVDEEKSGVFEKKSQYWKVDLTPEIAVPETEKQDTFSMASYGETITPTFMIAESEREMVNAY